MNHDPIGSLDFGALRAREFSRLDASGHVYLDYTGAALYPESLVRAHCDSLCRCVLGNPHSRNPTSREMTERVDLARTRVLDYFDGDPDEYEVVFTPNATGAIKLVAESFPFAPDSRLLLTADNHNSAHGIREYAARRGADVRYAPLSPDLTVAELPAHLEGAHAGSENLLVFPAQSNFSGVKHPLAWIAEARAFGYRSFLDAAAFVPTNQLRLSEHSPDYVCVSFYKMFGYPTGVGALIARREAMEILQRPWFSGGTVRFVSAQPGVELLYRNSRGFEDGTLNFLGIDAVVAGLEFIDAVGVDRVGAHVAELTARLLAGMKEIRHADGTPVIALYGPADTRMRGGTIAFNVVDPSGRVWDFRQVDDRAGAARISLRTGYFCNPGAAETALAHPDADIRRCVQGHTPESFDIEAFSDCMDHRAVGAVRASLGIASNTADVDRLVRFLGSFRNLPADTGFGAAVGIKI